MDKAINVIVRIVGILTFKLMVQRAEGTGWALQLDDKEKPKRYICPHCLEVAKARRALNSKATQSDLLLKRAAGGNRGAVMFTHKETGLRMLAHHLCGWRRVETYEKAKTITEETVPTNPVTAAAKGTVMAARAAKKLAKKAAQPPLPVVGDDTDC